MTWAEPLAILLLPAALAASWAIFRRRADGPGGAAPANIRRLWADHDRVSDAPAARRRGTRGALLVLATIGTLLALARPQWGAVPETTYERSREVLIALDLSRSMLADDVAPTRLARAKLLVEALLDRLRGERVGLVVFAGTSFVQSPLSADYEVLREFLAALEPAYLPQGGTNYDAMLATAVRGFGQEGDGDRFLVVLSDGEAHDAQWKDAVPALRARGIRVIGLGVGTPDGALVPDVDGGFVKDERGAAVLSRLEARTLQELATATGGTYRDAAAWVDIAELVQVTVGQGQKGEYVEERTVRLQDRYQWFLAPALAFLLLSFWLELPLWPIARSIRRFAPPSGTAARIAAAAILALTWGAAAGAAPEEDENPIERVVSELVAKSVVGTGDYATLAAATITAASQPGALDRPARSAVIDDALAGVRAGEAMDPSAADWPALRSQLEALKQADDRPQEQPSPPQSDEPQSDQQERDGEKHGAQDQSSAANQAGQPGEQAANESQGSTGDGSEAAPPAGGNQEETHETPNETSGQGASDEPRASDEDTAGAGEPDPMAPPTDEAQAGAEADGRTAQRPQPRGDAADGEQTPQNNREPQPLAGNDAGFGALDDVQDNAAGVHGAGDTPNAGLRMVGGGRAHGEPSSDDDLAAIAAAERMNRVKEGDAPAVLFDRMNRAEGQPRPAAPGKNW